MTIVEHMLEIIKRRERKPNRPRQRDEAIYAQVRVEGKTQVAVAAEQGLSQPRISQIVRRVEDWRRSKEFLGDEHDQQAPRRRIDRALDRQRLEEAYVRGMRAQERAERESVTTEKSGERDGKAWSERSVRQQGVNVQGLKSALRAIEMLWKLEDRPQGNTGRRNAVEELEDAVAQLCYVRKCALGYRKLQCTETPEETVERLVEELIGAEPVGAFRTGGEADVGVKGSGVFGGTNPYNMDTPSPPKTPDPLAAEREAYRDYVPCAPPDESPDEIAPEPIAPTAGARTSCAPRSKPQPPLESWIMVPVKKPAISPPLSPAQRAARREFLPRMEWVEYDASGKEIPRS